MVKKGFTFSEITQDGTAILKGEYEGYKNCDIYIYSVQNGKKVNNVAVSFPYQDTWSALSDDYYKLKETLTKRYGHRAVVENLSMTIYKGDIYGFIGKNGAGKNRPHSTTSGHLEEDLLK